MATSGEREFGRMMVAALKKAENEAKERARHERRLRRQQMSPEDAAADEKAEGQEMRRAAWNAIGTNFLGAVVYVLYSAVKFVGLLIIGGAIWACLIQLLLWVLKLGIDMSDLTWKQSFLVGVVIVFILRLFVIGRKSS